MVASMPEKSEATPGMEFCFSDAASPLAIMAKYRCPALVSADRVASSISLDVWQSSPRAKGRQASETTTKAMPAKTRFRREIIEAAPLREIKRRPHYRCRSPAFVCCYPANSFYDNHIHGVLLPSVSYQSPWCHRIN